MDSQRNRSHANHRKDHQVKFQKDDRNPTYSGRLTLTRENSRFEIARHSDGKVAFANRLPRHDSRVWSRNFLVWDLNNNCEAVMAVKAIK